MKIFTVFILIISLSVMVTADDAIPTREIVACDKSEGWIGGSVDGELSKSGKGSIRWAHGESSSLHMASPPRDWSTHNYNSLLDAQ